MEAMKLENWSKRDYVNLYDEIMMNFIPSYRPAQPPKGRTKTSFQQNQRFDRGLLELIASGNELARLKSGLSFSEEDKSFVKRYVQLKFAVQFRQKQKFLGKYCFYGCWCFPNGAGDLGIGTGDPVDNIDKSCREYSTCYNCMYSANLNAPCSEREIGHYNVYGREDERSGDNMLICADDIGSCKRQRCECDLALAEKLAGLENEWNIQNHRKWGQPPFNWERRCLKHSGTTKRNRIRKVKMF